MPVLLVNVFCSSNLGEDYTILPRLPTFSFALETTLFQTPVIGFRCRMSLRSRRNHGRRYILSFRSNVMRIHFVVLAVVFGDIKRVMDYPTTPDKVLKALGKIWRCV
jgi:hypothetical protein